MTVLVGYVPRPEGEAAFSAGLEEARRRGEDLVVLNSPKGGAPVNADAASADAIATMRTRAETAGVPMDFRQHDHTDDLADEVIRTAGEINASLIVIGLRRRSPVGKLIMGSSAQRILLDADRPVLAVKPRPHTAA
jgi:nucleotide-binding universal stress UspA family protein